MALTLLYYPYIVYRVHYKLQCLFSPCNVARLDPNSNTRVVIAILYNDQVQIVFPFTLTIITIPNHVQMTHNCLFVTKFVKVNCT